MDHQMDEDGNYPNDVNKLYGPKKSTEYLQAQISHLEQTRKQRLDAFNQRKNEIYQQGLKDKNKLTRIENLQTDIRNVEMVFGIGAVLLLGLQFAIGGVGLLRQFWKGWKLKRKKRQSRVITTNEGARDDGQYLMEAEVRQVDRGSLVPRRLHARHWRISEPL